MGNIRECFQRTVMAAHAPKNSFSCLLSLFSSGKIEKKKEILEQFRMRIKCFRIVLSKPKSIFELELYEVRLLEQINLLVCVICVDL